MYKTTLFLVILLFLLSGFIISDDPNHLFFNSSFHPDKAVKKQKVRIQFLDSIPDDTLTIYFKNRDLPSAFSRDFHTAVCLDTLCRVVDITLYWEPTGKYLGYSLPYDKELTRKEHAPFSEKDYSRLHEILGDSSSQLKIFTPADLHPVRKSVTKTDGITGATLPDLAAWIVPEAAYSSYTLWHLTYGVTRDSLMAYARSHLISSELINVLLQPNDPYNQIVALQWIEDAKLNSSQFLEPALLVLHSQNYRTAGQALKFLKKFGLNPERLQKEVIPLLDSEDFRIKYVAIEYFRELTTIPESVARQMMIRLNMDNYYMVNVILSLFENRFHPGQDDQKELSKLLAGKNLNVANRVYHFLLKIPDKSPDLDKQLTRYRRRAL
jgi:hypothetical protein